MKRQIFRWLTAAVLAVAWSIPASAARLLVPVGEVVGLALSEGTVTVAAFHETYGGPAREAGVQIGDEILSVDGRAVDSAQDCTATVAVPMRTASASMLRWPTWPMLIRFTTMTA